MERSSPYLYHQNHGLQQNEPTLHAQLPTSKTPTFESQNRQPVPVIQRESNEQTRPSSPASTKSSATLGASYMYNPGYHSTFMYTHHHRHHHHHPNHHPNLHPAAYSPWKGMPMMMGAMVTSREPPHPRIQDHSLDDAASNSFKGDDGATIAPAAESEVLERDVLMLGSKGSLLPDFSEAGTPPSVSPLPPSPLPPPASTAGVSVVSKGEIHQGKRRSGSGGDDDENQGWSGQDGKKNGGSGSRDGRGLVSDPGVVAMYARRHVGPVVVMQREEMGKNEEEKVVVEKQQRQQQQQQQQQSEEILKEVEVSCFDVPPCVVGCHGSILVSPPSSLHATASAAVVEPITVCASAVGVLSCEREESLSRMLGGVFDSGYDDAGEVRVEQGGGGGGDAHFKVEEVKEKEKEEEEEDLFMETLHRKFVESGEVEK
jgi:hypothetical protein